MCTSTPIFCRNTFTVRACAAASVLAGLTYPPPSVFGDLDPPLDPFSTSPHAALGLAAGDFLLAAGGESVDSVTRPGVPASFASSSRLASEMIPSSSADAAALAALRARLASFSSGVRCFFLSLSLSLDFFFFFSRRSSPSS